VTTPRPPIPLLFTYTTLFRSKYRLFAEINLFVPKRNSFIRAHARVEHEHHQCVIAPACKLSLVGRFQEHFDFFVGVARHEIIFRSEEHTSELQSRESLVRRLL